MCDGQHQRGGRGSAKACFKVVDVEAPMGAQMLHNSAQQCIIVHYCAPMGASTASSLPAIAANLRWPNANTDAR